jgi:hypothetical protein
MRTKDNPGKALWKSLSWKKSSKGNETNNVETVSEESSSEENSSEEISSEEVSSEENSSEQANIVNVKSCSAPELRSSAQVKIQKSSAYSDSVKIHKTSSHNELPSGAVTDLVHGAIRGALKNSMQFSSNFFEDNTFQQSAAAGKEVILPLAGEDSQ